MKLYKDNTLLLQSLLTRCKGVSIDSRKTRPGEIFFAFRGERVDGNDFAEDVVARGALCAVVERGSAISEKVFAGEADENKFIVVENVLKTMQELAQWHRKRFDIPVVGITGTNGKTTTKELVTAVLSQKYKVTATEGNLNNAIGVPLTLFRINEDTKVAVIEMGASERGSIALLCEIARPTCGLITGVGKAHLSGFGSFEGVKAAKGELYDYLWRAGGTVLYNVDDENLRQMVASRYGVHTVKYGRRLEGWTVSCATVMRPFLSAHKERRYIRTNLLGEYNIDNALAAIAVGKFLRVSFAAATRAIRAYHPVNNRSQLMKTGKNTLILDTYNANPTSMRISVTNFVSTSFPHKVLILGDMLELGNDSAAEHAAIMDLLSASAVSVEKVFLVGSEFGKAAADRKGKYELFPDVNVLKERLNSAPLSGKTVFVKGSNSIRLQTLVEVL